MADADPPHLNADTVCVRDHLDSQSVRPPTREPEDEHTLRRFLGGVGHARILIHVAIVLAFLTVASCTGGGSIDDIFILTSDCQRPDNEAANCGFDADVAGWRVNLTGSGSHVANDGSPRGGCIEVVAELSGLEYFAMVDQCISVSPSTTYDSSST